MVKRSGCLGHQLTLYYSLDWQRYHLSNNTHKFTMSSWVLTKLKIRDSTSHLEFNSANAEINCVRLALEASSAAADRIPLKLAVEAGNMYQNA